MNPQTTINFKGKSIAGTTIIFLLAMAMAISMILVGLTS